MKRIRILSLALVLSGVLTCLNCHAAIVYPKPPEGGKQVVLKYLDPQSLKFLGVSQVDDLTIAEPYGDYVGGTNLVAGKFLSSARLSSWRYPLMQGTNVVGVMELNADKTLGRMLKFFSLARSNTNNTSLEALRQAAQLPQVQKRVYEIRYLNLAPASFWAIWLHNATDDIIMPLPPTYGRFKPSQLYSESQVVAILKPAMERSAAMWKKLRDQEQRNFDAFERAMTAYEEAHGGKCGNISYYGIGSIHTVKPGVWTAELMGKSDKCGVLTYRARISFGGERLDVVRHVEILKQLNQ